MVKISDLFFRVMKLFDFQTLFLCRIYNWVSVFDNIGIRKRIKEVSSGPILGLV